MNIALGLAEEAFAQGEVLVGAVIVKRDQTIGKVMNQMELLRDPTAHAEIVAIKETANTLSGLFK